MFLRYLVRQDLLETNPADNLEYPRIGSKIYLRNILTLNEIKRILKVSLSLDKHSLRDKALLELCFSTGMRSKELFTLELNDINYEKKEILLRETKNKHDRIVPLCSRAEYWLLKYLEELRDSLLSYISRTSHFSL